MAAQQLTQKGPQHMSQYADDRDVDNEMRNDIEDMIRMRYAADRETYDFDDEPNDPVNAPRELTADEMTTLRAALLIAGVLAKGKESGRYMSLYESLVYTPRLIAPPF